jgi:hypothetical protein
MNKFIIFFWFKLTYNLCEFKNIIIKFSAMLFPLCKYVHFLKIESYFPQFD